VKKWGAFSEAASNSSFEGHQLHYFSSGPEPRQSNPRKGNDGADALGTLTESFSFPECLHNEKISGLPVENSVDLGISKGPGNITGYIAFWFT